MSMSCVAHALLIVIVMLFKLSNSCECLQYRSRSGRGRTKHVLSPQGLSHVWPESPSVGVHAGRDSIHTALEYALRAAILLHGGILERGVQVLVVLFVYHVEHGLVHVFGTGNRSFLYIAHLVGNLCLISSIFCGLTRFLSYSFRILQMMVSLTKDSTTAQGFGGVFIGTTSLFSGLLLRPQNVTGFWLWGKSHGPCCHHEWILLWFAVSCNDLFAFFVLIHHPSVLGLSRSCKFDV